MNTLLAYLSKYPLWMSPFIKARATLPVTTVITRSPHNATEIRIHTAAITNWDGRFEDSGKAVLPQISLNNGDYFDLERDFNHETVALSLEQTMSGVTQCLRSYLYRLQAEPEDAKAEGWIAFHPSVIVRPDATAVRRVAG